MKRVQVKRIRRIIFRQYIIHGELVTYVGGRRVHGDFDEICQFFRDNMQVNWAEVTNTTPIAHRLVIKDGKLTVRQ